MRQGTRRHRIGRRPTDGARACLRWALLGLVLLVMGLAPFLHTHLHPTEPTGFHLDGLSLDRIHPDHTDDHDAVHAATASPLSKPAPSQSALAGGGAEAVLGVLVCAVLWAGRGVLLHLLWCTAVSPFPTRLHQRPNRPPPALAPPVH